MTVDEETVYVSFNEHVYAIELETGNEIWRFPKEPDRNMTFFAPPEPTSDGKVIVGGFDNVVYALTEDGRIEGGGWTFDESLDKIIGGSTTWSAMPLFHGPILVRIAPLSCGPLT